MSCAAISTTLTYGNDKEGRSYWIPDTQTSTLNAIDGGTLSLETGATSHLVDSLYGGLNRWQVLNVSETVFQAAKFQPNDKVLTEDDTDQSVYNYWSGKRDYNFKGGDEVDIYRMHIDESSNVTWDALKQRTLSGATELLGAAVAAIVATSLF